MKKTLFILAAIVGSASASHSEVASPQSHHTSPFGSPSFTDGASWAPSSTARASGYEISPEVSTALHELLARSSREEVIAIWTAAQTSKVGTPDVAQRTQSQPEKTVGTLRIRGDNPVIDMSSPATLLQGILAMKENFASVSLPVQKNILTCLRDISSRHPGETSYSLVSSMDGDDSNVILAAQRALSILPKTRVCLQTHCHVTRK